MPSAKILEAKKALVKDLNEKIVSSLAGVVVAYNGISVADDTKLRKELREAGVHYMVVKNTMLRLAVKGTQYEALTDCFKGDTAIALSAEDPAAAARAAGGAAAPAEEEKTEFDVILADVGANKMQVIKTVKELTGASLMEAKKLVETPNAKLKEQASKADAEDIQKKLAEVGAKVELK